MSDEASPTSAHPLLESAIQIQEIELNKVCASNPYSFN